MGFSPTTCQVRVATFDESRLLLRLLILILFLNPLRQVLANPLRQLRIAVCTAGPQPPNRLPEYMPKSMPEYMSDRMPKYLTDKCLSSW